MKTKTVFTIEIMRHNVTPSEFLSYVRTSVDRKGGHYVRSDLDLCYFRAGCDLNFRYDDGTPETKGAVSEVIVSKPYQMQTYIRNFDGSVYNEICEFDFDDDKRGTGYYYLISTETAEEDAEVNQMETTKEILRRSEDKLANNEKKIAKITDELNDELASDWFKSTKKYDIVCLDLENAKLEAKAQECKKWLEEWERAHHKTASDLVAMTYAEVSKIKTRSAWERGVKAYALDFLEEMEFNAAHGYLDEDVFSNQTMLRDALLNGASDWSQYSWGGCSLIYDGDIAERLCNPTELKRTKHGERKPNFSEEWLDVQARALGQAAWWVVKSSGVPNPSMYTVW